MMSRFVTKFLIVLTFIFLLGINNFTQSEKQNKPEISIFNLTENRKPIVYAKENDGLPNKIKAKGEIVEASVSGIYCGTVATGGTLKIRLAERIKNYNNDFLYVVVLCLAGAENENLVGQNIEFEVKKITEFPYKFGVLLSNGIDSNGSPFYLSTVEGVGGLLKQIKEKSKKQK